MKVFRKHRSRQSGWLVLLMGVVVAGCATQIAQLTPIQITAMLAAPDRSSADRDNDGRRKARDMLAFIDARPGMRVLDVGSGGGYTAELLARIVGPAGQVVAHNSPEFMKNIIKERFAERLKMYVKPNLSLHVAPFENPLPETVAKGSIDLVTFMFVYHDLGWAGADRAQVNRAVFDALKPGSYYVLADHSGRAGTELE